MKKIVYALLMLLSFSLSVFGADISPQQAQEKARIFMQQMKKQSSSVRLRRTPINISMVQAETGHQSLYAFNADGGGLSLWLATTVLKMYLPIRPMAISMVTTCHQHYKVFWTATSMG